MDALSIFLQNNMTLSLFFGITSLIGFIFYMRSMDITETNIGVILTYISVFTTGIVIGVAGLTVWLSNHTVIIKP